MGLVVSLKPSAEPRFAPREHPGEVIRMHDIEPGEKRLLDRYLAIDEADSRKPPIAWWAPFLIVGLAFGGWVIVYGLIALLRGS